MVAVVTALVVVTVVLAYRLSAQAQVVFAVVFDGRDAGLVEFAVATVAEFAEALPASVFAFATAVAVFRW